jgi:hypothetical protein
VVYTVLKTFIEKEHGNVLYTEGETYPKAGFEAKDDRVASLQKGENKYKVAFLGPELQQKTNEDKVAVDPELKNEEPDQKEDSKTEQVQEPAKSKGNGKGKSTKEE